MDRLFDPKDAIVRKDLPKGLARVGDRRDGSVYFYDPPSIVLAINVALAAGRPLLVAGPPGCGKSSLALNVAQVLDAADGSERWSYESEVITPRTQARDLLWRYDAVKRLRDAQAKTIDDSGTTYVEKGVLWRAFQPRGGGRVVVLLDEIDKADPDVPNSLLEALGALTFTVVETGEVVAATETEPPFVMLTTNDERELSKPFLRRCVVLRLPRPNVARLQRIAEAHGLDDDAELALRTAERIDALATEADDAGHPAPGAAEYIDALRAARRLGIGLQDPEWQAVLDVTLNKQVQATAP
jgi:MoxR-like ATPase